MPAAFLRPSPRRGPGGLERLRAAASWMHPKGRTSPLQGGGGSPDAPECCPKGRTLPLDDDSDPARAVVTPPHLPEKMSGFYALMHGVLWAARRGPPAVRWGDFVMQSYALWLCTFAI